MDTENLVKMANSIGDFFGTEPDKEVGVAGALDHLKRFWESRMRTAIIKHYEAGGAGLNEIAKAAVARLAADEKKIEA